MRYQGLYILLSCHGLEDFPVHHTGVEAASLLANWTAMWHPVLLYNAGKAPTWARIDNPPEDIQGKLLLVPLPNKNELQSGFAQRVEAEGGRLVKGEVDREQIIKLAMDGIESDHQPMNDDLIRDFYALGYCFLQIQTLTRHMRYSSNLDEVYFNKQLLAAATAAAEGCQAQARELLASCFDVLAEERDHFYPVNAFLIDVTLVASTTLGQSLRHQVELSHDQNLLISATDLETLSQENPGLLGFIKQALNEKRIEIIGGNHREIPMSQMSQESVRRQFEKAIEVYQQLAIAPPAVFARRRFGLSTTMPQMLEQFGFKGAIHVSLDQGRTPEGMQTLTRWEGSGDESIDVLATFPLEIDKPESFLNLGIKLGEAMDMDHLAIIWFAHWPNQQCVWLEDLLRVHHYCGALGKFVKLSEFFAETDTPLHNERFGPDQYRSPFLKQSVLKKETNPISRSVDFWRRESNLQAINSISFLASVTSEQQAFAKPALLELRDRIDDSFETTETGDRGCAQLDENLAQQLSKAVGQFAETIPREAVDQSPGYLVVNTNSFIRRMNIDVSRLPALPAVEKPVYATANVGERKLAVVDVPPMGFAWVTAGNQAPPNDPSLVEEATLRNEFMEVIIDEKSGGVRAIHDYQSRATRLSAKLALRHPTESTRSGNSKEWIYTDVVADSVEATVSSSVLGEIVAQGKFTQPITEEDQTPIVLGQFKVTYRLWRGSRVLDIDVEIEPVGELFDDPWNSYFGLRCAWNDETSDLFRSVQQTRHPTSSERVEAGHFFEIVTEKHRTAILTRGLTYLRQRGLRMIDVPLICQGEHSRMFSLGIGIDLTHPMQQATGLMTPDIAMFTEGKPQVDHCWLFHVDARNVVATWWEPIIENGKQTGFRVRLLETMGRVGPLNISAFRPIKSAHRVDFLGNGKHGCEIKNDKISYQIEGHQFIELEAYW